MPPSTRGSKKAKIDTPIVLSEDVQADIADTKVELKKYTWAGKKETGTRVSILWHVSGSKKNPEDYQEKWFDGTMSYDDFQYRIDLDPFERDGKLVSGKSDGFTLERLNKWVEDNALIILERAPAALVAA